MLLLFIFILIGVQRVSNKFDYVLASRNEKDVAYIFIENLCIYIYNIYTSINILICLSGRLI